MNLDPFLLDKKFFLNRFGLDDMSFAINKCDVVFRWVIGGTKFLLSEPLTPHIKSECVGSWPFKYIRESINYESIDKRFLSILSEATK